VINDVEIEITLNSPLAPFLGFLGAPATAIVQNIHPDSTTVDLKNYPLGTGTWIFKQWQADRQIRMARNENYYAGPAKLEGILLNNIQEVLTSASGCNDHPKL